MHPALPQFTPSERALAGHLLAVLAPHFDAAVRRAYARKFCADPRQRERDTFGEEAVKYGKLFRLELDEGYLAAKRRIIDRAAGREIALADYPQLCLEDFSHFLQIVTAGWKRRWGPLDEAMRLFCRLMLTDLSYSLSFFDDAIESSIGGRLAALEGSFRNGIAERIRAIESGMSEVAGFSGRLACKADATLQAVAGTKARPEQVSASVAEIVRATRDFGASSARIMQETAASSQATDEASVECRGIADNVAALRQANERIGSVVELIRNLASQTNLLALNATIEAARAGEAGRGFAVVAGEVKSLANATNSATEAIRQGVEQVVDAGAAIELAVRELSQTMQSMQASTRIVADSVAGQAARIEAIAGQAESSSSGVDAIAHHAGLVEGLAGEAATLARQMDERVKATTSLSAELERSIGNFLGEVAQARAERQRASSLRTG